MADVIESSQQEESSSDLAPWQIDQNMEHYYNQRDEDSQNGKIKETEQSKSSLK